MATHDVSVLIVSWNTCSLTEACLDAIPRGLGAGLTHEVVVVDNNSTDGSAEMLRARGDIVVVENDCNAGYAAAVNQAFARSTGRYVLLLNSDVEVLEGSLAELVRFLDRNPTVAGVGPRYLNPDGSLQHHHFRLPTVSALLAASSAAYRRVPSMRRALERYRMLDETFTLPTPIEQPSASCLLLRREAIAGPKLMDESFPIYFNDVVLAHRLREARQTLWMIPEAEVIHAHGASTRLLGTALRRQHLTAMTRYVMLSQPRSKRAIFRVGILAHGLAARVVKRSQALPVRDLLAALSGDAGSLPQQPRP
jgi:GT2 family glycosyltransferase